MRFVFDTNVIISAALFELSVPGQALQRALKLGMVLLSQETLLELQVVLSRPKFQRYVNAIEREEFLASLIKRAHWIEPQAQITASRDPKDNKFLELALTGNAVCIVSGDDDLLCLHPFRSVRILTPQQFLEQFPHPHRT